jgi:hypothetical protein
VTITPFGGCWVVICLLFGSQPMRLLQLIILGSTFEASAVLILGGAQDGFPFAPPVVPALMLIAYLGLKYLLGQHFPGERRVFYALVPLFLVTVYALATAKLMPNFLEGAVFVWPQRFNPLAPGAVPLVPSRGNFTHSVYLLLYVSLLTLVALYVTRRGFRHIVLVRTYFVSGYMAVFIALWQFASNMTGLYYPEEFLHSNTTWVIFSGQTMGDVRRINGSFTEPSSLAFFLCGIIFSCFWLVLRGHRGRSVSILLVLASFTNLLSTSTTGIVATAIGLPAMILFQWFRGRTPGLRTIGIGLAALLAAGLFGSMVLPGVAPRLDRAITDVVEGTTNKESTESYDVRSRQDRDSFNLVFETYGMGAGWGSVRASSFFPSLIGNVGIVGLLVVCWFALSVTRQAGRARRLASSLDQIFVIDAASAALVGTLAAALISAPEIDLLSFYVLLALLIGCSARIELEAFARGRAVRRPTAVRVMAEAHSATRAGAAGALP